MSMQLSNSKLRQAQLKPDRATCSHYYLPLSTPSHSSVEQQPGLALAQSPLLSCFPAPWAGHTLCHAIASNALKEKSSRTHTHPNTHTRTQYAFVALIDTWRETRGSSRRCGGNSQMQKMQKARAYCPWKCRSHKHTHTDTHARTRRRLRMKLC